MRLVESKTNSDAVDDVITFSERVNGIEIYHENASNQEFEVNGITINVPPYGYTAAMGGIPSDEVTIPSGLICIVNRLG